jgi:hypothetical protein
MSGRFLLLSIGVVLSTSATRTSAQEVAAGAEAQAPSPVRFFFGASAAGSVQVLPGFAVGAEADGRLAIADFLWVGLAGAFSVAPGFRAENDAGCCDMISSAEGDAYAIEALLRVGLRGPLTPGLTIGLLTGLGVAGVYGSGTLFGGIAGSHEFSEWWTVVEIPVELEFVWTIADVGIVVGAGPTFVLGDDDLLERSGDEERPHVGGRVRVGVLFAP